MARYLRWAIGLSLGFSVLLASAAVRNSPPTVTLTSPSAGATYVAPASVSLTANAADSDGTISKVEFFRGTTLIGTSTAAPYAAVWSNVAAGSYSLTAKATDNAGATTTSAAVAITVTAPNNKLVITSPAAGSTAYGASVTVSGTYIDSSTSTVATVLADNGSSTRLAALSGNTFSASVPLYVGTNTLTVTVARADKTFDRASVTINGNLAPLVVFKSPSTTTTFNAPANIAMTVDALSPTGSINGVNFYNNGTLLGASNAPPYAFTWTNVAAGTYSVSATATDNNGQAGTASLPIIVSGPNQPPSVSLTAPSANAVFSAPATIGVAATASDPDGTIKQVEFLQNGQLRAVTNVAPYTFQLNNVQAGSYSFTARATDNVGATTLSAPIAVSVTPPNSPPTVTLSSPQAGTGTIFAPASIVLNASATDTDGTISKVEFFQASSLIGSVTSAPYTLTWPTAAAGSYSFTARATDNLGATATSAAITVTITAPPPNNPPTVSLTSPPPGASAFAPGAFTLSANAADSDGSIAKVEFFQGTTLIGTTTAAPYTFAWSSVPAGAYTLTAVATDNRGASTTSAPVAVTVQGLQLAFSAPADGAALSGDSVLVKGSFQGPANTGITVNGSMAALDANNNFYATVPLVPGGNALTATLTTQSGQTATLTLNVSSDGVAPPIRISTDTVEGVQSMTATFTIEGEGAIPGNISISGGSATVTQSGNALMVNYPAPGTYPTSITGSDAAGNTVVQSFVIVVQDAARLDLRLKALWSGMNDLLVAGNKGTAMTYLSGSAQEKYGPVFDVLMADYQQIISTWSAPITGTVSIESGEYGVVTEPSNGVRELFLINFVKGTDGVWRLESM